MVWNQDINLLAYNPVRKQRTSSKGQLHVPFTLRVFLVTAPHPGRTPSLPDTILVPGEDFFLVPSLFVLCPVLIEQFAISFQLLFFDARFIVSFTIYRSLEE